METNKLYNEDCLITLGRTPDEFINVVFTSPPYANQRDSSYGGIDEDKYIEWFLPIANQIKRTLNKRGSFFLNIKEHTNSGTGRSMYVFELVLAIVKECGFILIDTYCWTRNSFPGKIKNKFKNAWEPIYHFALQPDIDIFPDSVAQPMLPQSKARSFRASSGVTKNGSGFQSTASKKMQNTDIAYPSNHIHLVNNLNQFSENQWHPAVFPEDLADFFISTFSNRGGVIYDPFSGSGTTLKVAHLLGRKWIGSEIKENYFNMTNDRLKNYLPIAKLF